MIEMMYGHLDPGMTSLSLTFLRKLHHIHCRKKDQTITLLEEHLKENNFSQPKISHPTSSTSLIPRPSLRIRSLTISLKVLEKERARSASSRGRAMHDLKLASHLLVKHWDKG
jgi:hypothetical protein